MVTQARRGRAKSRKTQPCEILRWDARFFGFRIARVRGDTLTRERVGEIDTWCRKNDIVCLYLLARSDDAETTRLAEAAGFQMVDIRVTLMRRTAGQVPATRNSEMGSVVLRASRPGDVPILQNLARELYRDTRFYYDANFPRHLCDALYETWITRSHRGYADVVLVAELNRKPVGYVSCHLERPPVPGRIGLVGVSSEAAGRGVGRALVLAAIDWFQKQGVREVSVVTQGRNCAAQRLYQRCGFLSHAVQIWYHKWYTRDAAARQ